MTLGVSQLFGLLLLLLINVVFELTFVNSLLQYYFTRIEISVKIDTSKTLEASNIFTTTH